MPGELRLAVEAQAEQEKEREKAEWYKLAWFVSYLLRPYVKRGRTIDPDMLLPESMRKKRKPRTKEEAQKELRELKKSVGMKDDD